MFKRKLIALDYHNPNNFKANDESEFRNLIVWLEDQKIRHYKIEDRAPLRNTKADDWPNALDRYLKALGCTVEFTERNALIDWILGYSVRLEYGDNVSKYKGMSPAGSSSASDKTKSSNPLDGMDFDSPDFKAGVASLALLLQIPPHPDHMQVLKAICLLIQEKLSKEAIETLQKEGIKPSQLLAMDQVDLGLETPDYITAEAAKILRVLHIHELRDLQNFANQAIVAVQSITANPKTDTRLGQVGRM